MAVRRAGAIGAGVFLAGYLALLLANTCYFATGPDTSGYLGHARLVAAGRLSAPIQPLLEAGLPPALAYVFTPYGFAAGPQPGTMVPTYPVGAPLHFAAAAVVGGWARGPFVVAPLAAAGCLWLLFFLARRFGLSAPWAAAVAAILAAMPVYIGNSLSAASDVLAAFWTLVAIHCALRVPAHRGWAVAAGLAFAIGVAVRPTNILLAVPLALAIGPRLSRLLLAAVAALPAGVALMLYHDALYGSPFVTGYGSAGSVLNFSGLPACLAMQTRSLVSVMTPFVFPGGLLVVFVRAVERRTRALLLSWFGVFFVFYAYYGFCPDASALRFLLPALPPLILGFLLALRSLMQTTLLRGSAGRALAGAIVLAIVAREVVLVGRMHILHANEWESIFPRTAAWVDANVPEGSVVLSSIVSGALYYQSGRITVRWDQLDPATAALLRTKAPFRGEWYAVVSDVEGGVAALRARASGDWQQAGRIRDVTFWRRVD